MLVRNLLYFCIIIFGTASNLYGFTISSLTEENLSQASSMLLCTKEGNWQKAEEIAKNADDKLLLDLYKYIKFNDRLSTKDFHEAKKFLDSHSNWPDIASLKTRIEEVVNSSLTPKEISVWFAANPPKTPRGLHICVEADQKLSKDKVISEKHRLELISTWINKKFDKVTEKTYFEKYQDILKPEHHVKKIRNLLWQGDFVLAERALDFMELDDKDHFYSLLDLLKNPDDIYEKYQNNDLNDDSILTLQLLKHLSKQELTETVSEILLNLKKPLEYPKKFWQYHKINIRDLIKQKNYSLAYKLAKNNFAPDDDDKVDAEFLAGWIALRFLNEPNTAITHFKELNDLVHFPISIARASYWLGRSYEAVGSTHEARSSFQKAANYPETYYGMLAADKLGTTPVIGFRRNTKATDEDFELANNDKLARAAIYLGLGGRTDLARKFMIRSVMNTKSEGTIIALTELGTKIGLPHLSVQAAKQAVKKQVFNIDSFYPRISDLEDYDESALFLSLTRQESEFDQFAVSPAGAMGLMQLMPETAKIVARSLDMDFEPQRLFDKSYNTKLGAQNLNKLLKDFRGSYILTIAAYNAGPGSVSKWINKFGDPRGFKSIDDVVDWVELIPFGETRNYVQRVLENKQIYEYVLDKAKQPQLVRDMMGGSKVAG